MDTLKLLVGTAAYWKPKMVVIELMEVQKASLDTMNSMTRISQVAAKMGFVEDAGPELALADILQVQVSLK